MRTTLDIDGDALDAAMKVSEARTNVNEALRLFVRAKRCRQLLDLRGKVAWEGRLDALRKRQ